MALSKKEMGLAVKAIAKYASDCSGNGDYLEMDKAFKIATNMASMYELREESFIVSAWGIYSHKAFIDLEHKIAEGEEAQDILNELNKR